MARRPIGGALGALLCLPPALALARVGAQPPAPTAFLRRHCLACHRGAAPQGGLDLAPFLTARVGNAELPRWRNVLRKVHSGEMPPPGAARPDARNVAEFTSWLDREVARVEESLPPDPGRPVVRRLNRVEYDNTIRALLGVEARAAEEFPQDDSGHGFDNSGDVLSLPPVLLERYLAAAERIAREAVFGPKPGKPYVVQHRPPERRFEFNEEIPAEYDRTGLCLPNSLHVIHSFPADAEYVIRAVLRGTRPAGSDPLPMTLWLDERPIAEARLLPKGASFYTDRQDFAGKFHEFRVRVPAGRRLVSVAIPRFYEGLPPRYGGPNPARPAPEAQPRRESRERGVRPVNEARVFHFEIEGPFKPEEKSSPERNPLLSCGHAARGHTTDCGRAALSAFLPRAFRRPVPDAEEARYVRLFEEAVREGQGVEEGLALAVQAILVSPSFLFRIEGKGPQGPSPAPVDEHALAVRLSYFLWSAPPDEILIRLAGAGRLRANLDEQVRRMLRDPRSDALAENFAGQWLELRKLEGVRPDRERFPEFDEYLRHSMRRESELFFMHVLREERSLMDFIGAPYSFLNERLARFYSVPGVLGPEFRKVSLAGGRGGGLLTQAGILTLSSYATRTSPVLRGRWILENLLDSPPPPPPPGVPALEQAKVAPGATLRQQLEAHRADPGCAGCHVRMDSLGFALENYSAIGSFREMDGKAPVDAAGTLPDGRSFRGAAEMIRILKSEQAAVTRCLTTKMLTYALGRGIEESDAPSVRAIMKAVSRDGFRLSALVREIVRSVPFQMRRGAVKP